MLTTLIQKHPIFTARNDKHALTRRRRALTHDNRVLKKRIQPIVCLYTDCYINIFLNAFIFVTASAAAAAAGVRSFRS